MMTRQNAEPASAARIMYACCTFGDLLGCLARLRITVGPLPGLEHLGGRPVVPEGISPQDAERLSGPANYEFPVLVEIPAESRCDGGWLAQSVPLSQAGAILFRSEPERERIVNSILDDVPVEGLLTRVQPELFGRAEVALPVQATPRNVPERTWIADALGGAMCGLLLAVVRRADCAQRLEEGFPAPWHHWPGAVDVFRDLSSGAPSVQDRASLALAAFTVALRLSGKPGLDPDDILGLFSGVLGEWNWHADAEMVDSWSRYAREITSWHRALSVDEVRDPVDEKGNLVLRALLLSLFREQIDHALEDRVDGQLAGARVAMVAAMLVGMRTGLHRCSRELKQPFATVLGEFAAAVESPGGAAMLFESFMPTAGYKGHGRSRVLRVADGADRMLATHPAPEETLLDRLVRILTAGGVAVSAVDGNCSVSQGAETIYLTTSLPVAAAPIKPPRRRRTNTKKVETDAAAAVPEDPAAATAQPADTAGPDAGKAKGRPAGRKPGARKAKSTAGATGGGKKAAGTGDPSASVEPAPGEPTQMGDLFSDSARGPGKP